MNNKEEANIPINILVEDAPEYQREYVINNPAPSIKLNNNELNDDNILEDLLKMISHPNLCSRKWIWEQYDHMVMADTVVRPGSDAAVVRVHDTNKGIAISTDCSPTYCKHNSFEGGKHAVVETWRNLIASGALPIAITDCMNFGNPEKPEIMGQFVECIRGMGEACSKLDYPVISGNVSFYNETNGEGIYPTPAIGGVGLIKDLSNVMTIALKKDGNYLCVIGKSNNHLGNSQYLSIIKNKELGSTPSIDLNEELKNGKFVLNCIEQKKFEAVHDIADGGLLVALSEMSMCGEKGVQVDINKSSLLGYFFGEDQSRYLVEVSKDNFEDLMSEAENNNVFVEKIGVTQDNQFEINNIGKIPVQELIRAHELWFQKFTN